MQIQFQLPRGTRRFQAYMEFTDADEAKRLFEDGLDYTAMSGMPIPPEGAEVYVPGSTFGMTVKHVIYCYGPADASDIPHTPYVLVVLK